MSEKSKVYQREPKKETDNKTTPGITVNPASWEGYVHMLGFNHLGAIRSKHGGNTLEKIPQPYTDTAKKAYKLYWYKDISPKCWLKPRSKSENVSLQNKTSYFTGSLEVIKEGPSKLL